MLIAISESRRPRRNSVRYPVNAGIVLFKTYLIVRSKVQRFGSAIVASVFRQESSPAPPPPEEPPASGPAITAETALADLPPTKTPGFTPIAVLGLNATSEEGNPVGGVRAADPAPGGGADQWPPLLGRPIHRPPEEPGLSDRRMGQGFRLE